jgi:hypothetical protein
VKRQREVCVVYFVPKKRVSSFERAKKWESTKVGEIILVAAARLLCEEKSDIAGFILNLHIVQICRLSSLKI